MDQAVEEKPSVDVAVMAERYIDLRNQIDDLKAKQKEELEVLELQQAAVTSALLDHCNAINADSIKTAGGTISRRVQSRYWTGDWGAMYKFIAEHEAPFLLEQRIHNGNMKMFLEENPDLLPIGLQADRKYVIQVRKPNSK